LPQQRKLIVKTIGSPNKDKETKVKVEREDAEEFNRWIAEEKNQGRTIEDVHFGPPLSDDA
jgi:hypothetical protein